MSPTNAPEVRAIRKWFLIALVISLAFHGVLFIVFRTKELKRFNFSAPTERLIPRAFTVKKVTINEDLLKPASTPEPKKTEPPKTVFQNEKPSADKLPADVRFTPAASAGDLTKAITSEKPRVEGAKITTPEANAQIEKEISSIPDQITSKTAPKIVAGNGAAMPKSNGEGLEGEGYSDINTLLSQTGPINGKARIGENMPGGVLFEYDSAKLSKNADEALAPIGKLLQGSPRSTCVIEGYTDSFGTPEYNLKLSLARADAVKAWLVKNMKLDPAKIQTKGFGSTHLIDPATGTREQQTKNRRVEFIIRTPKD